MFGWISYVSQHLLLLLPSLCLATIISIALILLMRYVKQTSYVILPLLSFIYTIPSLALFVLLIPFLGLGWDTAVIALTLYATFVLTTGLQTALNQVDDGKIEAGLGLGYSEWTVFWKIRCVYALPSILSSLRLTSISIIGIGTIASVVNAGGLGLLIFEGLSQQRYDKIITGSILVAVLALLVNYIFLVLEDIARHYVRGEKHGD